MNEKKVNTAVLVSGGGTNLAAIIAAGGENKTPHVNLSLVISNRADAYALKRAQAAGIKTEVIDKKSMTQEEFESRLIGLLEQNGIELIVLAGFMCILSESFTSKYPERIINVHPSLIPSFCGKGFYGLRVHEAALSYGVKVTGATVHFVNEIPDGGKIIDQKAVYVEPGDTPEILQKRVMQEAEHIILPRAVESVAAKIIQGEDL